MNANQAAEKMKERGWKTVKVWPRGNILLEEWAESDNRDWNADTALGCLVPRGVDSHTAYYGTLWCSKQ
jgi:hypothetical protein